MVVRAREEEDLSWPCSLTLTCSKLNSFSARRHLKANTPGLTVFRPASKLNSPSCSRSETETQLINGATYLEPVSLEILERPPDGLLPLEVEDEIRVCYLQVTRGQLDTILTRKYLQIMSHSLRPYIIDVDDRKHVGMDIVDIEFAGHTPHGWGLSHSTLSPLCSGSQSSVQGVSWREQLTRSH